MEQHIMNAKKIIETYDGPKLRIMEVCGTHTHHIFQLGIRNLLPENIELVSGPGCPVCVTPVSYMDKAIALALNHQVTICTFGDLMRIPGTEMSLIQARAKGANIRVVYTPLDAVDYAQTNPTEEVVFLAVGFETTVPAICLAVKRAAEEQIYNFSILSANKTMRQTYSFLKESADCFLFPGHVNAITGEAELRDLVNDGISGVIAGFTTKELLVALAVMLEKSKKREPFLVNCYPRVVKPEGNVAAKNLIGKFMEPCDAKWRGLGMIKDSGLKLKKEFRIFDAEEKYDLSFVRSQENRGCRCGEILRGQCKPTDCMLFGKCCTPEHPIGACMVSQEGTCAAYYQYYD